MQFIKRLFWFCVILCGGILIGGSFYLTPERLNEIVQPRLKSAFGRDVVMEEVDWGVSDGVVVKGLKVKDKSGSGALVEAERAQVDLSPGTLFGGEGKLGELVLEEAVVSIVVDKDGNVNAADVLGGMQLPVDRVRMVNSTLRVENQKSGRITVVDDINGRVRGSKREGAIVLDTDLVIGEVVIKKDTAGLRNLHLAGQMTLFDGYLKADDVKVGVGPFAVQVSGTVRDPWHAFVVDLKGDDQALDLERLRSFFIASDILSSDASLTGSGRGNIAVVGAWPFEVRGKVTLDGVAMTDRSQLALSIVNGELDMFIEGNRIRVHAAKGQIGRSDMAISGVVDQVWSGRPHASFALVSKVMDLDEMKPEQKAVALRWTGAAFASRQNGGIDALVADMDLDGSIRINEGVWHNAVFTYLETALRARNGRLHVGPVFGQLHDGALKCSIVLNQGQVEASVSLVNSRADEVVQSLGWQIPISGSVNLTVKVAGIKDGIASASGSARMAQARLVKWDFLQRELHSVEQLGLLTADEVPLKDVTIAFRKDGDEISLDGTKFVAADMDCIVGGKGSLDGALNYVLDVDVPASRIKVAGFNIGQALGALLGKQSTIPVRVKVGGTLDVPEVIAEMR